MSDLELVRGSNGTGEAVRATVVGVRPTGSTILSVDSVMAWPNRFIATSATLGGDGVTPDPASVRVFVGKINGSNIEIESFVPGYTDAGNSVGDIIVLKQTTAWADNLADILDDFNVRDSALTNTFDEMFGDGVVSGMAITYPATGRVADISAGVAYIGAKRVTVAASSRTYTATRDTYIMLKDDGTLTYPDVAVGGAAPVPPAGSILIGKLTTDATKFTALQNMNRGVVKAQNVDYGTFYNARGNLQQQTLTTSAVNNTTVTIPSYVKPSSVVELNISIEYNNAGGPLKDMQCDVLKNGTLIGSRFTGATAGVYFVTGQWLDNVTVNPSDTLVIRFLKTNGNAGGEVVSRSTYTIKQVG